MPQRVCAYHVCQAPPMKASTRRISFSQLDALRTIATRGVFLYEDPVGRLGDAVGPTRSMLHSSLVSVKAKVLSRGFRRRRKFVCYRPLMSRAALVQILAR
jgi:hypothetical protein